MSPDTRQITPDFVRALVAAHARDLVPRLRVFRANRALWRTQFWQDRAEGLADRYESVAVDGMIKVEPPRVHGFVNGYVGSLFTDRVRCKVGPDPTGKGDPKKCGILANAWFHSKAIAKRAQDTIRQALIYDGAGMKLGLDPKIKNPRKKTWARVIPWWEILFDRDVRDVEDQRFIGHAFYMPSGEAAARFAIPNLKTTQRPDVLSESTTEAPSLAYGAAGNRPHTDPVNESFVRVVEIYNRVDDYCAGEADPVTGMPLGDYVPVLDKNGQPILLRGRFEVYLPDQNLPGPAQVFPMPFVDTDGEPIFPIKPLILVCDPEHPLHGLSSVERVYDAIREVILERTWAANGVKRNGRAIITEEGRFDAKEEEAWTRGEDGVVLHMKKKEGEAVSPGSCWAPMALGPLAADNERYVNRVEDDIHQGGARPSSQGPPSEASATEVRIRNAYDNTEIGMLALSVNLWLLEIGQLWQRLQIAAIRAAGPSAKLEVTVRHEVVSVTAEDLDADFDWDISPGPVTDIDADRAQQKFVGILGIALPVIYAVAKGSKVDAMILDEIVDLFDLPASFLAENIEKLAAANHPDADTTAIPRGPGAQSALPGAGSQPSLPESTVPPDKGGMPMPTGPQPADVANGQAQNGAGAPLVTEAQ